MRDSWNEGMERHVEAWDPLPTADLLDLLLEESVEKVTAMGADFMVVNFI